VVAASVVGVLDVFTLEVEVEASPVRRGSILGELEHLRGGWGWELLHCRGDGRVLDVFTPEVEVGASPIRRGRVVLFPFLGEELISALSLSARPDHSKFAKRRHLQGFLLDWSLEAPPSPALCRSHTFVESVRFGSCRVMTNIATSTN
jgi:hypothetical protein